MRRKWTKEEIKDYRELHGSLFYFNTEDSNFFIPKAYGYGWTMNWANPISWIIVALVIIMIVVRKFR
ncbi:DUF5808 domain-containing protein [Clostridium fungisolvens]|uniref:DUF5808 domain-containing protein n=1 Tax=Clostridium fungisolvens TaxID=1604897 RepID=A0A6V8SFY6_9CLOT|nr:DUF5808 domain-containing protein [Clostridium fungisolvens]GFP75395.1 hypothetical protein bsdtw1_01475 [Clostridium fungisolvens]